MDGLTFSFEVFGRRALFTDPVTKIGGEKMTYQLPTYQALKGITESIYWKPTLIWHVKRVRIMNQIKTESVGIRPLKYGDGGNELAYYNYLTDVRYRVEVEYFWNESRAELNCDRDHRKHNSIFRRVIEKGGRRDIFLGTRECQAYVKPCLFEEGEGYYDETGNLSYGIMFHSFIYPDENQIDEDNGSLSVNLWNPVMKDGVVEFIPPDQCQFKRHIYNSSIKKFELGSNIKEVKDELD